MNINVITHSAIKISGDKAIYVDPFEISDEAHDADVVFITHSHYDHFSPEDIEKVRKHNTVLVYPKSMEADVVKAGYVPAENVAVLPYEKGNAAGITFETVPAYNIGKPFHPKENSWVGYILELEGERVYICGDTDDNGDVEKVSCDIALVPVGGTYTMTAEEAAELVKIIKPRVAIPTHYGTVVGNKEDGEKFKRYVGEAVEVRLERY